MIRKNPAQQRERGEPDGLTSFLFPAQIAAVFWTVAAGLAFADLQAMTLPPRRCKLSRESVTIVVPARNEAHHIGAWVANARAQTYSAQSIIIADDCSDDGTAAVAEESARDDRRVVVENFGEPPPGWIGKCWAADNAARRATTSWLLFSDADMRLKPCALERAMQAVNDLQADALSLSATIECASIADRAVMPAIAAIIFSSLPAFLVNNDRVPTALLAGGFLLVRTAAYSRVGGHGAVRSQIAEDLALARRLKAFGYRVRLKNGSTLLRVRMYETFAQLWSGWQKNFYEGAGRSPAWAAIFVGMSISMLVLPLPLLTALWFRRARRRLSRDEVQLARAVLISCAATVCVRTIRDRSIGYRTDLLSLITTPLAGIFVSAVMVSSAWRMLSGQGQIWKGRTIAQRRA